MGVLSRIPALILRGGKDPTGVVNGRASAQELWKLGRSARAPWTFAIEPDADHDSLESLRRSNDLVIPWIKAVFHQRVSGDSSLRLLSDDTDWLGDNQSSEAAPFPMFVVSKTEASLSLANSNLIPQVSGTRDDWFSARRCG
jgi:hypothetical protein